MTVGSFHAGEAGNVLPEEAKFTGILRTMGARPGTGQGGFSLHCFRHCRRDGVEAEIEIFESYPGCRNNQP